jgi:outer membrane protein
MPADAIYLQALECTPEIKKLKADLKAKEFHVEAEKAERLPKAEIASQYEVFSNTNNYADYYKNFSRSNVIFGLSLQIPIFDGSRTSSKVAQSRQEVSESRIRLDGQMSELKMSIERGLSDLRLAQESSQVARDDAEVARKTVLVNETLLEGGRISPKEMESFRSILQQKELALLQVEQVLFERKLELLRVAGSISSALQ